MNPSSVYEQVQTAELEGRALEASVLLRAARKLSRCAKGWPRRGTPEFEEELREALAFTQRLWTFLQVEATNPENPLPQSVRLSIFRLSRFVDRGVANLQSGGSIESLDSLVMVNREIAAGLASNDPSMC